MNVRVFCASVCGAAVLSSCTGGGVYPSTPAPSVASPAFSRAPVGAKSEIHRTKAILRIRIRIRRKGRHPHYISTATKGVTLDFNGPTKLHEALGLTPSSNPNCSNSGGGTTCTIDAQLLSGKYTASVTTYDQAPVGGTIPVGASALSTAQNVAFTMTGGIVNQIGFALSGVVAAISVSGLPTGAAGTSFSSPQKFNVAGKDADGNTIVGTYENAISLADSDKLGATTIATSGSDSPPSGKLVSSSDLATLNYTGLAIGPATITASASGASDGTGTFTPTLQPIVFATSDSLNPAWPGADFYASSGAGSTVTLNVSEAGWSNAPYNKAFTASTGGACVSIGSIAPATGTSFTATVATTPVVGTCSATMSDGAGQSVSMTFAYTAYGYTGSVQSITVPAGVTQMTVVTAGAQGGSGGIGTAAGGLGGSVTGTVTVGSGTALTIQVGGPGGAGTSDTNGPGGYNGGADGGTAATCNGGGGGGASSLLVLSPPATIAAAGGGGGSGCGSASGGGGAGGATSIGNQAGTGGSACGGGGSGAFEFSAGSGGAGCGGAGTGGTGGLGVGGAAGTSGLSGAGGGGGGYYGGGGGGGDSTGSGAGGGGGGSDFIYSPVGSATNISTTLGTQSGNGFVTIIW